MTQLGNRNTPVPIKGDQLQDGLVTTSKIADGAITQSKFAPGAIPEPEPGVPTGCILMWSGSVATIPDGWFLCDGSNGTPDLRDRFIVGAGSTYNPGDTGGTDSVTLTTSQLPSHSHGSGSLATSSAGSHSHTGSTNITGSHNHLYGGGDQTGGLGNPLMTSSSSNRLASTQNDGGHSHSLSINSNGSHTHSISGSTADAGSGDSHENRPPYYALCLIMKG